MALNRVRVALWTIQWLAMMAYFALLAARGGTSTSQATKAHGFARVAV